MELPFEKTVCRYWKQKLYSLVSREENQELRLPDSMPDVGRIISSWGQVILRGKDWRDRGVNISGGVMVWVLYSPEDGGALQHLESWIPFQAKCDFPDAQDNGEVRVETFLQSMDARAVSSRKIMLRTGISMIVQAMVPEEMEVFSLGDLPEDLETRITRYPFVLTREAGEKTFLMDEELTLPSGLPPVDQIVYFRMSPEILEQKVMGNKSAFRGMGNLHILYIDPDGRLNPADFQVPFAQYAELDGEYEEDATASNLLSVTSLELDPEPDGTLHLKCGLVSQHLICSNETVEMLEDCYSLCRAVELEKQLMSVHAWMETQQRSLDFSGTFSGEEGQPIDLIFFPDAPKMTRSSGSVDLELGGVFQAVMLDKEKGYSSKNERAAQNLRLDTECDTVCFPVQTGTPTCRSEAGSWRTDTRVLVDLGSLCAQPMETVTGVKLGQATAPDPERPSVIIRSRGSQESLWDLAKRCGSTVGAIQRMNHLEGEPEEDRLLLIPVM